MLDAGMYALCDTSKHAWKKHWSQLQLPRSSLPKLRRTVAAGSSSCPVAFRWLLLKGPSPCSQSSAHRSTVFICYIRAITASTHYPCPFPTASPIVRTPIRDNVISAISSSAHLLLSSGCIYAALKAGAVLHDSIFRATPDCSITIGNSFLCDSQ